MPVCHLLADWMEKRWGAHGCLMCQLPAKARASNDKVGQSQDDQADVCFGYARGFKVVDARARVAAAEESGRAHLDWWIAAILFWHGGIFDVGHVFDGEGVWRVMVTAELGGGCGNVQTGSF